MSKFANSDQVPAAARKAPKTPEEVAVVLEDAALAGRQVSVFSTGHGFAPLGDTSNSVIIDMRHFDRIEIDPETRIARVGGAVRWRDLQVEASKHGLVGRFGSSGSVGVVGYSMGGGLGPFGRHLGLASSAICSVELVTPDGYIRQIDASSDPDLFWAIRGGGGGFGVVTEIEIELAPMPKMAGGMLGWSIESAREVLGAWAGLTRTLPDDVTSGIRLVQPPEGSALVVINVVGVRSGDRLRDLLEPLFDLNPLVDMVGDTDPVRYIDECGDPDVDGPPMAIEHVMLDRLPAEALDLVADAAHPVTGCGAVMVELRHLGGALARPDTRSAMSHLDGNYSLMVMGVEPAQPAFAHVADLLSDFGRGRTYFNFMANVGNRATAYDPDSLGRLAELHESVDPDCRLMQAHPISRTASVVDENSEGPALATLPG